MKNTDQSIEIQAPIEKVWQAICNFHDMSWAPNVITSCEAVGDHKGTELGAKRILNNAFHETLLTCDNNAHEFSYQIENGPSPVSQEDVKNYIGKVKLTEQDGQTRVQWTSSWESESDDAVNFCHGIYVALLGDLKKSIEV